MRKLFVIIAFAVCHLAFGQVDLSKIDISDQVENPGEIIESYDFAMPYKCTLGLAVYSQTDDLSRAVILQDGITCTIDFLYFSANDTKLILTVYGQTEEPMSRREWKNVMLRYLKFENGRIGYEIIDVTKTYSFARLYPNIKRDRYWGYFNPFLLRDVL